MMKVKLDFVSNSSSTSFVYISKQELNEASFLKAVGVSPDSPVADVFAEMFKELRDAVGFSENITSETAIERYKEGYQFTPEVLERMKDAVGRGEQVVSGTFSSEGSLAEYAMCLEIFEIDSDDFYLNSFNNTW